jgi:anti-sigma factor RsiW
MNDYDKRRELLYASFDRELTAAEQKELQEGLRDPALKAEEEELKKMRALLGSTSWEFGEGFTERVMGRLARDNEGGKVVAMEASGQFFSLFRKIAAASIAAIIILLFSIYMTSGSLSKETVLGVDSFSEENLISYLLYEDFSQ